MRFDIRHDIEVEKAGGFFCQACLSGKPLVDQSPDPRYCQGCYQILEDEKHKSEGKPGTQHWSDCGQVFFTDGRGYAVAKDLRTVDIGKEADILKAFATGKIASDLCPDRVKVLEQILEYRREVKDNERTNKVKRPGDFRSRPIGIIKHREANLRHPSARKRVAIYKA